MSIEPVESTSERRPVSRRVSRTGETLHLIRTGAATTITDLCDLMDVARSTAAERVDRLLAHDLVRVVDSSVQEGRGRPAAAYEFNVQAGSILTAHVGMTGMRLGITDLAAALIVDDIVDIDLGAGPEALCTRLIEEFETLRAASPRAVPPVIGIGIGLPGRIELSGIPDVGASWVEFPFAQRLAARFQVPCRADRDVNLLALAEQIARHASRGVHICVKVGSAIGCGIAVDGQVVHGSDGLSGEIGHTRLVGRDDPCTCGNRGCLNAVASGAALVRQVAAAGFDVHHVRDVIALSENGVPEATEAIRQAGRDVGQVLAGCVNLLNPLTVSLWGYLLDAEAVLVAGIRESLAAFAAPAVAHGLTIVSTQDGDVTGLRGAAQLTIEHVLSPLEIDRRLDAARAHRSPAPT